MATTDDIVIPRFDFEEVSAPATPASGTVRLYAKSDGKLYIKDDAGTETDISTSAAGSVATDAIWDAAGDLAVGSGANAAAKLSLGATDGMVLGRVSSALAYALPIGYTWDRATYTGGSLSITGTAEGSETTVITGGTFTADGSALWVEVSLPRIDLTPGAAARFCHIMLYEQASLIGRLGTVQSTFVSGVGSSQQFHHKWYLTPSAGSRQYIVKAYKTNAGDSVAIIGGSGGSGGTSPAVLHVYKA